VIGVDVTSVEVVCIVTVVCACF